MSAPTPPPPVPLAAAGASSDALETERDGYIAPEKKSVEELMASKEGEDEAMQKYKASLLGAAAAGGGATDDPRRVVITQLDIVINGRDPITIDMTEEKNIGGGLTIQLKEGCEYKTQLTFRVQNELISGLKYKNIVSRGPVPVLKVNEMLGSYGPDPKKTNQIIFPRREWEDGERHRRASNRRSCAHPRLSPRPPSLFIACACVRAASSEWNDGEGHLQLQDLVRRR